MRAFVGCEDELAELQRALAAARSRRPRAVLIEGEAGIGKSSLLAQFVSLTGGASVLRASCDESELWLAYGVVARARLDGQAAAIAPATALLLRAAGIAPGMRVLDLGTGIGHVALQVAELVGSGGAVLGIDQDEALLAAAEQRAVAAGAENVHCLQPTYEHSRRRRRLMRSLDVGSCFTSPMPSRFSVTTSMR